MTTTNLPVFKTLPKFRPNVSKMVRGFSLLELILVISISAMSAAVAVPICSSNVKKAKLSEADANLGSIRTQLRIYYGQNSEYPREAPAGSVVGASWNDIDSGALTGRYFNDSSYSYVSATGTDFTLVCKAESMLKSDRTLNQSGILEGGH